MKPVDQTKFSTFFSDGRRNSYGNCLIACIASILEVPIDEIPNVYTFYGLHIKKYKKEEPLWLEVLNTWLDHKFKLKLIKVSRDENDPLGVKRSMYESDFSTFYLIARGLSKRGLPHCVVGLQTKGKFIMEHDPHPTHEGLKEIEYFWAFIKIK